MIGKQISHYKIIEELGQGGMGIVYRAEDIKLRRPVALKFLPPELTRNPGAKERFIHEAQAASALQHHNICTIHEIDETGEGQLFIVMAYCEGESLKDKITRGPLQVEEAIDIAAQVAEGLARAHEQGIFHRDIKPANIMVTQRREVKIVDFGLAKLAGADRRTREGATVGTIAYMSPEQTRGEDVDHRTDIWSLGVVLYEMVTGETPFAGEYDQAIIYSILNSEPRPISEIRPDLPLALRDIVQKCLVKEVNGRYQTAHALQRDLLSLKGSLSVEGDVHRSIETAESPRGGGRLRIAVAAAVVIAMAAVLFLLLPLYRGNVKRWLGLHPRSMAVLPFTYVAEGDDNRAFCEGYIDLLTSKLTQLEQFQTSFWIYPYEKIVAAGLTNPRDIGDELGVDLVLTGSMRRDANGVQLSLDIRHTSNLAGIGLPLERKDKLANLSIWQKDIVAEVAFLCGVDISPAVIERISAGETTMPKAYDSCVQGRGYLLRSRESDNLAKARARFESAVAQDSLYALAYAGLCEYNWLLFKKYKDPVTIEHVVKYSQKATSIADNLVPLYLRCGKEYSTIGRYEEAIIELQKALQFDPRNYWATVELAIVYDLNGRVAEAERLYCQAIKLRPDYWETYNSLGAFFYFCGRNKEARRVLSKAIKLRRNGIPPYNNLGAVYFKLGDLELAEEMFKRSISIGHNAEAFSNWGYILFARGLYADARDKFEQAIRLGDNNYIIWGNLADTYRYTHGDTSDIFAAYRAAVQYAEKRLEVNRHDDPARSSLATFKARLGNPGEALREISEVPWQVSTDLQVLLKCMVTYELIADRETALKILKRYVEVGGAAEDIKRELDLSGLRLDGRYTAIMRK